MGRKTVPVLLVGGPLDGQVVELPDNVLLYWKNRGDLVTCHEYGFQAAGEDGRVRFRYGGIKNYAVTG